MSDNNEKDHQHLNTESNKDNKENSGDKKIPFDKMKEKFLNKNSGPNKGGGNSFYWVYALVILGILSMVYFGGNDKSFFSGPRETTPKAFFEQMLAQGDVQDVLIVNQKVVEVTIYKDSLKKPVYSPGGKADFPDVKNTKGPHYIFKISDVKDFNMELKETMKNANLPLNKIVHPKSDDRESWTDYLGFLLPIILMVALWLFLMRRMNGSGGGGQIFNIGRSKAVLFDKDTNVNTTFNDVAGLEGAKIEIMEIVEFLKSPKKYTDIGAKIPKGALLVGPPGTGKTLLAKAVAGEAKVPFFSLSGSDFVEMFVGVGASRVRDLFRQAKEKSPCIIFIDEIDAIGRARGKGMAQGGNDERENTLNQLLTEMDGFGTNSGVIILAATNRADVLDAALLRPGRFDRQIYVDMPDVVERKQIFNVHLRPLKLDNTIDVEFLAKQTPGFSGADIANICNEAALIAARANKKVITKQDFLDAVDRIIGGLEKKNKIITPHEKKVIAYHEAGHATVSWLLEHASPLVKVTIVPRGRSLGAAWYLPEERQITTPDQIFDEMCATLGGRAAEEIVFGKVSTGALSDLEKITKQAYASIVYYGLNDRIGHVSYYDSTGQSEYSFSKPYSESTAMAIDEEVKKMIDIAYLRTKELLMNNKAKLAALADKLLEKEVIFRDDLELIFGKRPFEKDIMEDEKNEEKKREEEESKKESEVNPENNNNVPPITPL